MAGMKKKQVWKDPNYNKARTEQKASTAAKKTANALRNPTKQVTAKSAVTSKKSGFDKNLTF